MAYYGIVELNFQASRVFMRFVTSVYIVEAFWGNCEQVTNSWKSVSIHEICYSYVNCWSFLR